MTTRKTLTPDEDGDVRYPTVVVKLTGQDGNAFGIIARTRRALLDAGVPEDEVARFKALAMSGDFDNVLATVMKWVDVR